MLEKSILELGTDCNYEPPVITYRHIPVNWQDGTTSHIALVNEPRRQQPQSLEDRPIIIGGQQAQPDAFAETAVR